MAALLIKELTAFQNDVRRDLIADGISQPVPPTDRDFIKALIEYGNNYLLRAVRDPVNAGAMVWFDVHFKDPAVIGMTWAHNAQAPADPHTGMDFFWRIWSETLAPDGYILSLEQAQAAFATYSLQGLKI